MPKPKQKIRAEDVLRLGQDGAQLKASMSPARWKRFVKATHKRGFTVRSAATDTPDALKERTRSSLQKEAASTIGALYAPAKKELSQREAAIGFLTDKRQRDEASFNQWLTGETEKLEAQARAADGALSKQQSDIATEFEQNRTKAAADSLQRMSAQPGNVSDPKQSTALDTSAADELGREHIANARTNTAENIKIGEDSRQISRASLIAQAGARAAARQAETWKAMADVSTDREKLVLQQAADSASLVKDLLSENASKAQNNREFDLARVELGQKADSLAADIADSNRKFRLEEKKFDLDRWTSRNKVLVDQAKIQLGYDQIENVQGKQKADEALKKWIERYRARKRSQENDKDRKADGGKNGISTDERDLYKNVQTAAGFLTRWHKNKRVPPGEMRQKLRDMGVDDVTIDVAEDLRRNGGTLSAAGRAKARRLGIKHVGYFFSK